MPNRMLRDWTDSEKMAELTSQGERFFIRLIMKVDDFGNYPANLKFLNGNLFPLKDDVRDIDVAKWLDECIHVGLIEIYEVNEKKYISIINFGQRLDRARAKFPLPHESGAAVTNDNGDPVGYVYVIGMDFSQPVKIGHSINPWARLKELSTGDKKTYSMLATFRGPMKDEKAIHKLLREELREVHVKGEWFNLPEGIVVAIRSSFEAKETAIQLLERIRSSIVVVLRNTVVGTSPAELELEPELENEVEHERAREESRLTVWPTFDDFWDLYDKKNDRPKCEKKWEKINQGAREKIMLHLPEYIKSTPDKNYRKNPATYLNNQSWENEIIEPNNVTTGKITKNDRTGFNQTELEIIANHARGT
jgi:hypothetical protein